MSEKACTHGVPSRLSARRPSRWPAGMATVEPGHGQGGRGTPSQPLIGVDEVVAHDRRYPVAASPV